MDIRKSAPSEKCTVTRLIFALFASNSELEAILGQIGLTFFHLLDGISRRGIIYNENDFSSY